MNVESHLQILLLALALDAAIGDPPGLFRIVPHPVAVIGRLIGRLEQRWNRADRREAARRLFGVVALGIVLIVATAAGLLLHWSLKDWRHGWLIEAAVAALFLAQNSLYRHVADVARSLDRDGLEAGREAVRHIVGRDPSTLDRHGVGRAAIESLAENYSDGVVAPSFWFALFGLPGLLVYKTLNTADSMIGYRSERYLAFGWAAARLDDAANLVPARLSALLLAVAALPLSAERSTSALRTLWRDGQKHASPNAGYPEAAMAGALGMSLSGPRRYPGLRVNAPWIGQGRADAGPDDIRRGLRLYLVACALWAATIAAVYLLVRLA